MRRRRLFTAAGLALALAALTWSRRPWLRDRPWDEDVPASWESGWQR